MSSVSGSGFSSPDTSEHLETSVTSSLEHTILHKTVVESENNYEICDSKEVTFHKDVHGPTVAHGS